MVENDIARLYFQPNYTKSFLLTLLSLRDYIVFSIFLSFRFQGTTGRPKGVTLTHHSLVNNAVLIGQIMNYSEVRRNATFSVADMHCSNYLIISFFSPRLWYDDSRKRQNMTQTTQTES